MPNPSNYKDFPLPGDWLPWLDELVPAQCEVELPRAPEVVPTVDGLLELIGQRERIVLEWRWVRGETLERTGEHLGGITRERVRQLERKAVARFAERPEVLARLLRWIGERGLCAAALRPSRSREWPGATPRELWLFAVNALREVTGVPYATMELSTGGWVLYLQASWSERLRELYEHEPRWRAVEEVAEDLQVPLRDLELGHEFEPRLQRTRGRLLGWVRWNNSECLEALAWHLADRGVAEWHFSEMAKALGRVWPDRFTAMTGRDVLGILSRPGFDRFQNAGRNGIWRLSAQGDGFRSNREAVIALLQECTAPLHYEQIISQLQRPVRPATIHALLSRDSAFLGDGNGAYRLACPVEGR